MNRTTFLIVNMKAAKGKGAAKNSKEPLKPVDDRLVGLSLMAILAFWI